jgi:hypothetical protein
MLFASVYRFREHLDEADLKRLTQLFTSWTSPKGWEIKAHYAFADGTGGLVMVEGDSAQAMYEAHAPWGPFVEFKTVPLVDIAQSVPIDQKVHAWWDSVR